MTLPDSAAKCNTCKGVFSSIDKVKEHYRTDWHILNSKRRANNLAPLSKSEFKLVDANYSVKRSRSSTLLITPIESSSVKHEEDGGYKTIKSKVRYNF